MNLVFKPFPSSRCFSVLGADPEVIISNAIREGKEIEIYTDLSGARNVDTAIHYGAARLGVNIPIEGFKFNEKTNHNHFSGNDVTRHYFKKLKSQGIEEYKAYLKEVLAYCEEKWDVKIQQENITVYCCAF